MDGFGSASYKEANLSIHVFKNTCQLMAIHMLLIAIGQERHGYVSGAGTTMRCLCSCGEGIRVLQWQG